jgi:uncharacterized protein YggE
MKIIITICSLIMLISESGFAQPHGNLLKVQGEATLFEVPEEMNVRIPIEIRAAGYEECSNELINTYNALQSALVKNGVDKIAIFASSLNISENYVYLERERKLDGYIGQINVSIDLPHTDKKLTDIMNTMKDERFKFGYQVSFSLTEEQKQEILAEAIKSAIADASYKAGIIAESLELKLVTVQEVNFGYSQGMDPVLMRHDNMAYAKESSGDAELQLTPEKIQISKTVSIVWLIAK